MDKRHYFTHFLQSLALLLACCIPSAYGDSGYAVFCGAKDQTKLLAITPISALDDEQLFLSAHLLRTRVMSAQQRVFNYYWINQGTHNTIIGSRALSKLLRFSFARYWQSNSDVYMESIDDSPLMELNSWTTTNGDYSLRANNKSVTLRFSMEF